MKFQNPLLAVSDMERSVSFYKQVLGLDKIVDFGANVTLTGVYACKPEKHGQNLSTFPRRSWAGAER